MSMHSLPLFNPSGTPGGDENGRNARESEERYRLIASVISDYVFSVQYGAGGSVTDQWTGGAFEAITGYTPQEYFDRGGWLSILHPDDRELDQRNFEQLLARRQAVVEVRIIRKDGEVRWVRVYAHPQWDEEGDRLAGVYGAVQDITERRQIEDALRAGEIRYRAIVQGTTDLICRFLPDSTLTFVNEAYCRYFGKNLDQLVGTRFLSLIPEGEWADVQDHVAMVMRLREPVTYSHEVITPQGEIRWQQWTDSVILNEEGDVVELQSIGRDITDQKRTEEALKESQRRLSTAMRATRIGVWEWDMHTNKAYWSDENYRVLGLEPRSVEANYENWAKCVHPDDLSEADVKVSEALLNRSELNIEFRVVWPDGSIHWINDIGSILVDEMGEPLGMYGIQMEVTERKHATFELHQRAEEVSLLYRLGAALSGGENLYQALRAFARELKQVMSVDAFHIGMYDENTDVFNYSLFLNLGEDLHPPPRKLRENPGLTWEVISNRKTLYIPDVMDPQAQREHDIYWVVKSSVRTYLGIPLILQDRVIGIMSAQSVQPEAYTSDQVRLLETIATQVALTIEKLSLLEQVQKELAERKKAEAGLQQREAILEVVAEAANTFLKVSEWSAETWRIEVDNLLERLGNTIHASHAYIFENRLAEDGSIRMSMRYEWTAPGFLSDLGDPKYIDMPIGVDSLESWNNTILRGLPYIGDPEHHSPTDMNDLQRRGIDALLDVPIFIDGKWWGTIGFDEMSKPRNWSASEVDALVVAANLVGAAVKRRQMDSILQDELQKRKTLIEELENKNAELERFTYTVSHDLRSPLVTIRGFLGYLERHMRDGNMGAFRADMERISNATLQMDSLLKDLLELSRIGRLVNKPQDVPFGELVREASEIVRGRLESRGITLQTQPDLPTVHVDKTRLTEVLQNLFDNAAKYMGDQKEPVIEVGCRGYDASNHPIFFVRDNGIGIAPEYHERIFGLFDKLDASSEGTGVGLALVKRIIEFHGGGVWVESELGRGSTFFFTLAGGNSPGSAAAGNRP